MDEAATIHEAVKRVLRQSGEPMTLDEIISAIRSNDLYQFKVENPRGVVRQAIRRRCQGYTNSDRVADPFFNQVGNHTNALSNNQTNDNRQ